MSSSSHKHCCVPLCTQRGRRGPTGQNISFFSFPAEEELRKQWIHAIRRDVGSFFKITKWTQVCSLHFNGSDMRKSLGSSRLLLKANAIPSKFAWKRSSPRKRPPPTKRIHQVQSQVKKCFADNLSNTTPVLDTCCLSSSETEISEESIHAADSDEMCNSSTSEETYSSSTQMTLNEALHKIKELEEKCVLLQNKVSALEEKCEGLQSRVFELERFTSDESMVFYTGFPNYKTFLATFEFLNPGKDGENIRYWLSGDHGVSSDHYNVPPQFSAKRGRPRNLKPLEEFFLVMCRLRQGFLETHLAHLFNVSQSTVSRIFLSWINFMYLRFGVINIWPSRETVDKTIPEDFKKAYPNTRVVIDCTEVKCEMPSSLLLNSELFSSYKNHATLKGLVGISPSGANTFISQLYTGSISDREIVERSGFLNLPFDDGDSVMADKGFTISDILPLGVSLNLPPFLGNAKQMPPEEVVKTQEIARLRIHVERAINKIKNFHIWDSIVPMNLFGIVNQMWTVCAFLCNLQDPIISE